MLPSERWRSPADRRACAVALAVDPTMEPMLRRMLRMGAHDIHHDHMYVRGPEGKYVRIPDPGAWSGTITPHMGVMLLRSNDGAWFMVGY